jgi:hypothetical protein
MKYLKSFNENISIYDPKWEVFLPKTIVVLKGQDYGIDKLTYKKGNVMLNSDMLQISYDLNQWSAPDTFEIDIYLVKDDSGEEHQDQTTIVKGGTYDYDRSPGSYIHNLRLDVDITFGDMMASEFSITKNGISVIQGTSYGSKYDPTNTLFAIEDESLKKLVDFFNRFNIGVNLSLEDFNFLRNI